MEISYEDIKIAEQIIADNNEFEDLGLEIWRKLLGNMEPDIPTKGRDRTSMNDAQEVDWNCLLTAVTI
jgi:hypothetical protein